jgi:phosphoribosylaminoimidazole (AIR) synthetase
MLRTFNVGVGMNLVVPAKNIKKVESELHRRREKFYSIGHIETSSGAPRVVYSGKLPL